MSITTNVPVPPRSNIWTEADARAVLSAFDGKDERVETAEDGTETKVQLPPAVNVGFGEFKSQGSARAAGNSLNRMIEGVDPTRPKYSVSVVETTNEQGETVYRGVMFPRPAKAAPAKPASSNGGAPEATTPETPDETTPETPAPDAPGETPPETPLDPETVPDETPATPQTGTGNRRNRRQSNRSNR